MRKALVFVLLSISCGCSGGKTIVRVLEDAAKLAQGECLDKIAEATTVCYAESQALKK